MANQKRDITILDLRLAEQEATAKTEKTLRSKKCGAVRNAQKYRKFEDDQRLKAIEAKPSKLR